MRGQTCAVCCGGLCQHPECWRSNIQQVREAVWRRNGVKCHGESHESLKRDALYVQKEQHIDSRYGDLPTLKIVDMLSDLNVSIPNTSRKNLKPIHQRSWSLPCLPSAIVSHNSLLSPPQSPRQSPALISPPLTEYQRRMKWKKQFDGPSRIETPSNFVKMSPIGVHELYEEDELDQEWQEVYVTSAYLVWCPSTKKGRKAKRNLSKSSREKSSQNHKSVIPKDVTEELVPASMETTKQCRPKSTKTPTGGQPFSPHKSLTNTALYHYGMEDLSNLPKPVLSGILKRITWRSNEGTPNEDQQETKNNNDEVNDLTSRQQEVSKVLLAVDINSQLTTPLEDEQLEEQAVFDEEKNSIIKEAAALQTTDVNVIKHGRPFLSMHPIGLPIDDLPESKYHHCTNSIPRRMCLGVALEPVDLVPITPSPVTMPKQSSQPEVSVEKSKPNDPSLVVNVPSGRPESAPMPTSLDISEKFAEQYYVNSAFRYTPSPVRAPAPTPISPDKYLEFARYSRTARRRSSLQDEQILKSMRRWNTLGSVYDFDDASNKCALTDKKVLYEKKVEFLEEGGVFITEGNRDEINRMTDPIIKCRSPSPGSRTCIPKDIVEQFQGDIYGRRCPATAESNRMPSRKALTHIGAGIVAPGWRPPRSRTPIQLSETPARYPPRPPRQPPPESIPKSLKITSIPKKKGLMRPRSTPSRTTSPSDNDVVPLVLSESSLVNQSGDSTVSIEVQGLSSMVADPGAIPPPPSPEAMLALKNDLHPTLETLCEEDERSSRTTSIVDVVDKDIPFSRLSPLSGSSAISEESISLPISDERQSNDDSKVTELHLQNEIVCQSTSEKTHVNHTQDYPKYDINLDINQLELVKSVSKPQLQERPSEPRLLERSSEPRAQEVSSEPISTTENKTRKPSELHHTTGLSQPFQTLGFCGSHSTERRPELYLPEGLSEHQTEGMSEQHPQEGSSDPYLTVEACEPYPDSAEPQSLQVLPELLSPQESFQELKANSSQDLHQPPASPNVASTQDFTEGIDMELDLAAELQAAMEGLDSFDIDDVDKDCWES